MQTDFIDRARHARKCVHDMKGKQGAVAEYLTAVRGLPAEIRLVGLGQALATLLSRSDPKKAKTGFRHLYDHVEDWLMVRAIYDRPKDKPALLHAIVDGDNGQYRRAVAEADAYLAVLKRLAEALLTQGRPAAGGASEGAPR